MQLKIKKEVQVEARTISIHAKVSDRFTASIKDQDGKVIHEQEDGYVWPFFPEGGGDYIILDINIDTGQIMNWPVISAEDIEQVINGEEE